MSEEEIVEMHVIFGGQVQGVGFRATALYKAQELDLTGTVCNLPDGTVEVIAQGPRKFLDILLDYLKDEFRHSMVSSVKYKTPTWSYPSFRITYVK